MEIQTARASHSQWQRWPHLAAKSFLSCSLSFRLSCVRRPEDSDSAKRVMLSLRQVLRPRVSYPSELLALPSHSKPPPQWNIINHPIEDIRTFIGNAERLFPPMPRFCALLFVLSTKTAALQSTCSSAPAPPLNRSLTCNTPTSPLASSFA